MALLSSLTLYASPTNIALALIGGAFASLLCLFIFRIYFHPLAKFPGPWYAAATSLTGAAVLYKRKHQQWMAQLIQKYGKDTPIRVGPNQLLFSSSAALKDIYWNPKTNTKTSYYSSGALGPTSLFGVLPSDDHRALRKALSNAPWTIGQLMNTWEARFGDLVTLFIQKMHDHAAAQRTVNLGEKCSEFAVDIMTMIAFGEPWGCVERQDEYRGIIRNFRKDLDFVGLTMTWEFLRDRILHSNLLAPLISRFALPNEKTQAGMGFLIREADRQVTAREKQNKEKEFEGQPDFLQHLFNAQFSDGSSLSPTQKHANTVLLIQAGADTTGVALTGTMREVLLHPDVYARIRAEIDAADKAGHLSKPILYRETRAHLPFLTACLKETLRLHPPSTSILPRVAPKEGIIVDGHFVPGGAHITCHIGTSNRNPEIWGQDAQDFRPERWLESPEKTTQMESMLLSFGHGPRGCLGKDIAFMEMYKLLPEIFRHFDLELVHPGDYVHQGPIQWVSGVQARFIARKKA
ncbi:cytochrome P450 [Sporormia fimetaria CBS 119925]|uniref:Cytochrome P450 n=1 Tax=Sporormia fimetaria CBS 119925 TaxID=1340428 RepID=A0A6A6UYJ8_9PLEO|nr:cytochrome P450 [Sporormia fimetaria CBS 119925]